MKRLTVFFASLILAVPFMYAQNPSGDAATAYAKSDFVPGDEIFFEDTF